MALTHGNSAYSVFLCDTVPANGDSAANIAPAGNYIWVATKQMDIGEINNNEMIDIPGGLAQEIPLGYRKWKFRLNGTVIQEEATYDLDLTDVITILHTLLTATSPIYIAYKNQGKGVFIGETGKYYHKVRVDEWNMIAEGPLGVQLRAALSTRSA